MKKALITSLAMLVFFTGVAAATNNTSNGGLNINLPEINGSQIINQTHTGVGPVDDALSFLISISPFLLLILGIVIILLSGFARIIGIILVILAIIRILWMLFIK
jgi:hypothetical protein